MLPLIALQAAALAAPAPVPASPAPVVAPASAPAVTVPAAPVLGEKPNAVSIKTDDKLLLKASYFAPRSKKKQSPAALLLHDQGRTRTELDTLAAYLNKRGFAVLTLDLRGHGESANADADFEKADDKAKANLWNLAGRDVRAAAEFLTDQDGVHSTNLSIVGFGSAASLAVRRAVDDENVRAVVLVDPELETYEYDVQDGVNELGGLPTMVLTTKKGEDTAKGLRSAAHDANGGLEYVDVAVMKCAPDELLEDKKTRGRAGGWLRDQAMPKK
ncbi:MAG: alpha/beta fold hydrolase [Planctomycetota bacterium]